MQKTRVFSDFYCLADKLALMGLASWAKFSRPRSTSSGQALRDWFGDMGTPGFVCGEKDQAVVK
jgi:hypothetical protein